MEIPDIRIKGGDIDIIQIPFTPDYLLEPNCFEIKDFLGAEEGISSTLELWICRGSRLTLRR